MDHLHDARDDLLHPLSRTSVTKVMTLEGNFGKQAQFDGLRPLEKYDFTLEKGINTSKIFVGGIAIFYNCVWNKNDLTDDINNISIKEILLHSRFTSTIKI